MGANLLICKIKRRAAAAALPASTCCHTFRATGITAYLSNGGTLEHAQRIAGHASPLTARRIRTLRLPRPSGPRRAHGWDRGTRR